MPGFSITSLDLDRKNDLLAALTYFLDLHAGAAKKFKPNASVLKLVMATIDKAEKAEVGERLILTDEEFSVVYTAVQYMMAAMASPEGPAYIQSLFGDRRSEEFKSEMVEYFRDTCMYFVNECNEKFAEVPVFAMLRTQVEKQITAKRN